MSPGEELINGFPPANCLSKILTVRFATTEKQTPYFFSPHRAKQKYHTLVSNFIYPITIAMLTQLIPLGFQKES